MKRNILVRLCFLVSGFSLFCTCSETPEHRYDQLAANLLSQIKHEKQITLAIVGISDRDTELFLTTAFSRAKSNNVRIVSRALLDAALKELHFQYSDLFNEQKRQKLGKFVGASAVVVADMAKNDKSEIERLYLIDVETAELLAASMKEQILYKIDNSIDKILVTAALTDNPAIAILAAPIGTLTGDAFVSQFNTIQQNLTAHIVSYKNRKTPNVKILSRFKLESVLKEMKFQLEDLFDPDMRKKLGQFTGAEYVLVSSIEVQKKEINLQLLDVENAEVVAAQDFVYPDGDNYLRLWKNFYVRFSIGYVALYLLSLIILIILVLLLQSENDLFGAGVAIFLFILFFLVGIAIIILRIIKWIM